jgi:hypothetical protein
MKGFPTMVFLVCCLLSVEFFSYSMKFACKQVKTFKMKKDFAVELTNVFGQKLFVFVVHSH